MSKIRYLLNKIGTGKTPLGGGLAVRQFILKKTFTKSAAFDPL